MERIIKLVLLFVLGYLLPMYKTIGQEPIKKPYLASLNEQWSHSTNVLKTSNNGDWLIVQDSYQKGVKTYLIHSKRKTKLQLEDALTTEFSNDGKWLVYKTESNELKLIYLSNLDVKTFQYLASYQFSFDCHSTYVSYLEKKPDGGSDLILYDLKKAIITRVEDVSDFLWNPKGDKIGLVQTKQNSSAIGVYNLLDKNIRYWGDKTTYKLSLLDWSENGVALIGNENREGEIILYHLTETGQLSRLTNAEVKRELDETNIWTSNLLVSSDGKSVFFYRNKKIMDQKSDVEIWDSTDKWIIPRMKAWGESINERFLTKWSPLDHKLTAISDKDNPSAYYRLNQPYALVYDAMQYEPQYKQDTYVDLYVRNVKTGEKKLVVKHVYMGNYHEYAVFSPSGLSVAYFKEHHWYLYDIIQNTTRCLTQSLEGDFYNQYDNSIHNEAPIAVPIWSDDEKELLLQNQYDIWLVGAKTSFNLTKGHPKGIHYRLSKANNQLVEKKMTGYTFRDTFSFAEDQPLLIETTTDELKKGFVLLQNKTIKKLVDGELNFSKPQLFPVSHQFIYQTSAYNRSPTINRYDFKTKKTELIYQSNPLLGDYDLGRSEIIDYTYANGIHLKATLLYPVGYDATKKYPMVINIYEQTANEVFDFFPPSLYGYKGFNALNYVTNGYFVLLPNLHYEIGHTGESALKSVESVIKEVTSRNPSIDERRIGLNGHSFGGYETAFIATKSKLIKAAVAGGTVTDLQTWSHDIQGNGWGTDQFWRTESHQFRMGDNYYNAKENYKNNSPLDQVEQMTTPLLLWSGKEDYNTHWYQSEFLFMGMKRLNKKGQLVLFENEGHYISKPENQRTLSELVMKWFDNYLK